MERTMEIMPLVSVSVITYNSSKTVLETLDSIKAQTYQNIELIISDDCSTDNTVLICKDWVEINRTRFVRTVILESQINTGISANGNRAGAACRGKWVKGIAGDDSLMPECIEEFVRYAIMHPDYIYLFSRMKVIGGSYSQCQFIESSFDKRNSQMEQMTVDEQYRLIADGMTPPAPACFYNREKANELGIINDERIKLIEDVPQWLNILKKGVKLHFLDKTLVVYRCGGISTSQQWQSLPVFKCKRQIYFYYIFADNYKSDPEKTIDSLLAYECDLYNQYLEFRANYMKEIEIVNKVRRSIVYRLWNKTKKIIWFCR